MTFVEDFQHGWSLSKPDEWIGFFAPMVAADAVLTAFPAPTVVGPKGQAAFFRRYFALVQDAHAEVLSSAVDGENVFLSVRITGRVGTRPVSFKGLDHFTVRDGKIAGRDTWSESAPLLKAIALSPRQWVKAARFLTGR